MVIKPKHFLWHLLKSLLAATAVLVFTLITWCISSESGLKSLVSALSEHVPGVLKIEHLSGTLLSTVHAESIAYQNRHGHVFKVHTLSLTPRLSQLLAGRIGINDLQMDQLALTMPPTAKKASTHRSLPKLPHWKVPSWSITDLAQIDIKQWKISKLTINDASGQPHIFNNTQGKSRLLRNAIQGHFETQNPHFHNLKVNADISGTPKKYTITGQLSNDYAELPFQGQGDLTSLQVKLPQTQTLVGSLTLLARYQNNPPDIKVNIQSNDIELAKISPNYHGKINLIGSLNLSNTKQSILLSKLNGQYFNQPLKASGYAASNIKTLSKLSAHISLGDDLIDIDFDRGKQSMTWAANIKQLAIYGPNQSGTLITQGKLSEAAIHGSATGSDLALSQWHIAQLQLNLDGSAEQHHLLANLSNNQSEWIADMTGSLHNHVWSTVFSKLELHSKPTGLWQLQAPLKVSLQKDQLALSPFCWQHDQQSLCGSLNWSNANKTGQVTLNAKAFDVEPWSKLLWQPFAITGIGSLQSQLRFAAGIPSGKIKAELTQGGLFDASNKPLSDTFSLATFIASLNNNGLDSQLEIAFDQAPSLQASLSLPDFSPKENLSKQSIKGKIAWKTKALQWLKWFDFTHPSGEVAIDLQATGTLGSPHLLGDITLAQGQWSIPWLNIQLQDANLALKAQGSEAKITGKVQSGKGILHIDGTAKLTDGHMSSSLDLTGKHITVENTPDLMLVASPKLTLTTADKSIRITGKADIPEGELRFQDFSNTIELPEDTTFANAENNVQNQTTFSHHIELTLGDKVSVHTYGIKGLLTGGLILHKTPYRNTMVDGQLHLNHATYSTYGITLDIEQGLLNYTNNPFWSPWLSLTAIRDIKNDTTSTASTAHAVPSQVGISLEGSLNHLKTDYFSRPIGIANQQQILAYLVSGHSSSIDPTTVGRNAILFNLLQPNNANKKSPLGYTLSRIKNSLNLSEFTLDLYTNTPFSTTSGYDESYTSLLIGKQLSKRLYVKSNIGMPFGSLTLNYQLAKRWSIQASSSYGWSHESHPLETGADLFYNF